MKNPLLIIFILFLGFQGSLFSQGSASMREAKKDSVVAYTYPYVMPILGQKVADKGFQIPLPMGVMINTFFGNQNLTLSNMSVGFNDGPMYNLDSIIQFGDVTAQAFTLNTRIDTWIFPFWDLYVMGGYGNANTSVGIVKPVDFTTDTKSNGYYFGLGSTIAFGIRGFFGSLDGSYIWNYQNLLTKPAKLLTVGLRTGPVIRFKKHKDMNIVPWVGVLFTNLSNETVGSISSSEVFPGGGSQIDELQGKLDGWYDGLTPVKQKLYEDLYNNISDGLTNISENAGNSTIQYSMQKSIDRPYNMIIGGQWQINQRYQIRAEAQFLGDRTGGLLSFNYRFGIKGKNFLAGQN
ncbi:MAG TPA: hypothetical protein VIN10_13995 [Bacteroidales bacterium]